MPSASTLAYQTTSISYGFNLFVVLAPRTQKADTNRQTNMKDRKVIDKQTKGHDEEGHKGQRQIDKRT